MLEKLSSNVTCFLMRDILVRIKSLDKDQCFSLITTMMIKRGNLDEAWGRQGLFHNVGGWLQIIDKIWIGRGLGKRKNITRFPHMHLKDGAITLMKCPHKHVPPKQKKEISQAIKIIFFNML
jgi:hypothetical protein